MRLWLLLLLGAIQLWGATPEHVHWQLQFDGRPVAPGGKVIVGLNNKPINDIGVLTEKGGSISMIADGDVLVNNSKVITEFGGDLLLYSDLQI